MKTENKQIALNAQGAVGRAQEGNKFAKEAREHRDKRNKLIKLLEQWEHIMIDSPVVLFTIAFFVFAVVEIITSWRMYGELQAGILLHPNPFLSIFMGLMVVCLGAVVSHYIAKKLSGSVFALEVFNLQYESENTIAKAVAEEQVRIKARKHFITGMVLYALLFFAVLAISFQRVGLMGALTGLTFSFFSRILPVLVVTLEVFSGIYLGYFFRRRLKRKEIKYEHKQFELKKGICSYETNMCNETYQHALSKGEQISYSRDLRDSLYRYEHRSLDKENYVDEIPEQKNVKVLVVNQGKVFQGAHLVGLLPSQFSTNAIWTNEMGQAVVEWETNDDHLKSLMVNNLEHQGPFHTNSNVKIDIGNNKMLNAA